MQLPLVNPGSLAPTISDENLFRHLKLYENYRDELSKLLSTHQNKEPIERLFANPYLDISFKKSFLKNGGGYYNHTLFFENLTKNTTLPDSNLQNAINNAFGSLENLKIELKSKAMSIFGSGWCFLALDIYHNLVIINYPLHQNPLTDGLIPLLAIDVWEHSYYCQYINRGQYLNALLNIIDWKVVSNRYHNYDPSLFYES